jgi:hypothetical protein
MTTFLSKASLPLKFLLNMAIRGWDMQPLVKISVHDFLWNNSSPILRYGKKLAPNLLPVDNLGVLHMVSEVA